ncbi:MAG: CD1871A family CXXC motif-containing protein, partial [Eubacteriales bacterium]|nr:CD1871A family CXXC motif-containing protein [Eubacteriales bacterium]
CVLIAVLLSVAAVRIYLDGSAYQAAGHPSEWIYTREKVGSALLPILPVILISIAVTIAGFVKEIRDEDADKPVQDAELARNLMCARVAEPSEEMKKERDLQKKLRLGGWIGFAVCMVPILLYITNGGHFAQADPEGLDHSILSMIAFVVPWAVFGLASLVITTVLAGKSMERESEAASARMKEEKAAGVQKTPESVKADSRLYNTPPEIVSRRILLRRILLVAAVCFIIMGVLNGTMKDVLVKAIRICTECVGLG